MVNKRLINTGVAAAAAFDPLQNFETVTYTGNGGTQKITGYIRKGAAFNGSTSKIDLGDVDFFQGDFSISLFFNPVTNTGTDFQVIGIKRDNVVGDGTLEINLMLREGNHPTAAKTVLFAVAGGGTNYNILVSSNTYNFDSWNHLTAKISGTAMSITLNGTETTGTFSGTRQNISSEFRIGNKYGVDNDYPFNGKIDQIRIFNTGLDSTKIAQLAAEDYTKATKSTTDIFGDGSGVALYELDEDANSSNFEQAASFNGSSSVIDIPQGNLPTGSAARTISFWINTTQTTGVELFSYGTLSNNTYCTVNLNQNSSGQIGMAFFANDHPFSAPTINNGNWHHVCAVYDGNIVTLYLDGSSLGNSTAGAVNTSSAGSPKIGSTSFNGKLDQVRIYSSALSSGDVTNLYNESSVPTSTLVAHYKLDGDATDETGSYDGTETSITYSAGVYGGTPTNVNFLGMAFQPDLVWIKDRDNANWHSIADSVRGHSNTLFSNADLQNVYQDGNGYLNSFDSNGFTLTNGTLSANSVNGASNYVAWCWKAGGTAVSNTDGSITSTVSANQDAGFSIVKWTSDGFSGIKTMGHGLSQAPELIIVKNLDVSDNWGVYSATLGNNLLLRLNTTESQITATNYWSTSATNFGLRQSAFFGNGHEGIAYCFHSVDGYQKIGSYTGTGASGNTITTGFQPRWILIKNTTSGTSSSWWMVDAVRNTSNPRNNRLVADQNFIETTYTPANLDFNDNGFTLDGSYHGTNALNNIYIYLAIA